MKFTQTGTFKENSLEKIIAIKPLEKIEEVLLSKLDYFIGFVAKENSEIITDYVKNLTEKYQGLVEKDFSKNSFGELEKIFSKFLNLIQYPDLNKASLNYYLHLLQIKERGEWETNEVEISMKALIQAWIYPSYYFLEALAETIGREDAVKLFKRYITNYYIDHPSPDRDKFVSLEKMLENRLSGDTTSSEWVIVHTMLEEGKYAFKNKNCPTCVDSMKDLPDVEFKYLACCYGDYEKFRAIYSDHIILTMEHTLMEGDSYCSRVLHDTRIDYDLRHPPKEFWDNFKPGNEEEAMKYYKI
ncbi:MAG: L-2-amino-thiazoline-4-carboxylic acid hydrolase [Candidatus Heimdallarchaeota archaeon]|nr:L-2-amino-thiazoline-4-carboxylic acid hydrolase [Candidatus Heimdallarchaeota archaeon]MCG3258030.1 L-2-amino-thiazoline-4-carboxylic acid hydrolase [Candidatus Heimdallarchaeota archaeon]MCK4613079.1 L-2-amino-thiazoline-4-carboxylic acid hydrolase [Candidatus Heimdallarchaeota archaeon]